MKKNGMTLVEMIIVVTILIILAVIIVSNFNSIGIFNKARDAQRKKDLSRIRVAFEEYYNDKGCYPDSTLLAQLNSNTSCQTNAFSPWLSSWPCDPNKTPYLILSGNPLFDGKCSHWYKVVTKLENSLDSDIPSGWSYASNVVIGDNVSSATVNYGVSSPNISWYDQWTDPQCGAIGGCFAMTYDTPSICNSAGNGCVGPNCYVGLCRDSCRKTCCGVGCN